MGYILDIIVHGICRKKGKKDSRCRHTGQNQPFAFLFRLGFAGAAGAAPAGALAPAPGVPGTSSAPAAPTGSGACVIVPPAPNSTMFSAHSLHATRWRHGRSTTSRGDDRQSKHSSDAASSSSCCGCTASAAVFSSGGYVCATVGGGAVGVAACEEVDVRPKISCRWKV